MSRRIRMGIAGLGVAALGAMTMPAGAAQAATFGASWQMNEKTGAAVDSSGNGNNGTLHGGIVRTGSGYHFNGSSGYVSVPNSASLNPGSGNITLTVKFTLDSAPASGKDYDLVRKGLAGTKGGDYKMEVLSSGKALCLFRGTNGVSVTGGSNLGTGTHTVKCVKTSSAVKLIVDGSTKASKSAATGSISNTSSVFLGAKPGDDWTKGLIDFITIT
jgi:concanavalin A-like lectin/glucanase superfamily protein